jgi:hypothetical protein
LHDSQIVEQQLAERGVRLTDNLWMREIRRLNPSGAQASILSTDRRLNLSRIAAEMAAIGS